MKTASLKSAGTKEPVYCGFYEPFLVNWYKVRRAIEEAAAATSVVMTECQVRRNPEVQLRGPYSTSRQLQWPL